MKEHESGVQKEDTTAVWWTIIWSLIYGILFLPLIFIFGIWIFVIFEDGFSWIKATSALVGLSIPFSLPASIYLMWRYHNRGNYGMIYLAGCMPWMIVGTLFLIEQLFSVLQNLWKEIVVFPWHASGTPTSCIPHLFSALGN
jgi:hypothetical protein